MSALELFSLRDQVVVVTGGGSGLGRAMAEAVADAGAFVVVADVAPESARTTVEAITAAGGRAEAISVDVADEASVRSLVDGVIERHDRLDVVFCNAGISGYYRRIDEVDLDEWHRVIGINLTGVMLTAKHSARVMIPRGRGKIILTSSIWGLIGSDSVPIADYAASKGGVINLTRELGLQLVPHGITVNGIAPGFFDTNIGRDKSTGTEMKQILREASLALIPTHRRALPDEIKGTALFLASAASDMVNAHTVVVDAGCVAR